jgi:hypothetical protein
MDTVSNFLTPGIILLLTLVSGLWLSRTGKPFNTLIFTLHKLTALAAAVLAGMALYPLIQNSQIQFFIAPLTAVMALCALSLFISGP